MTITGPCRLPYCQSREAAIIAVIDTVDGCETWTYICQSCADRFDVVNGSHLPAHQHRDLLLKYIERQRRTAMALSPR